MPPSTFLRARGPAIALTAAIVALTLTTAYIHLSLGGLLFTLNALGYAVLAAAVDQVGKREAVDAGRPSRRPSLQCATCRLSPLSVRA